MAIQTRNCMDRNITPNSCAGVRKTISYGSIKQRPLSSTDITQHYYKSKNTNINQDNPVKTRSGKTQVSFTGLNFKNPFSKKAMTEFLHGVEEDGGHVLAYVSKYLKKENCVFKSIDFDVRYHNLDNEKINVITPFGTNLLRGFTDLPVFLYQKTKSMFNGVYKKQLEDDVEKRKVKNSLVGILMNVKKLVGDIEKTEKGGAHHEEIVKMFKDGISDKSRKNFADYCKKHTLKELFSIKHEEVEGSNEKVKKMSGVLNSDEKIQEFLNVITGKTDKTNRETYLEELKQKYVNRVFDKQIDKKAGSILPPFSASQAQLMARVVSGVIPAWFIANDFYNLRMSNSSDKKEAKQEWKSKFGQENFRIGIYAYQGYILNTVFQRLTNKSISFALFLNVVSSTASNVLSRVFTGRPVLPVNVKKATELARLHDAALNGKKSSHSTVSNQENLKNTPQTAKIDSLSNLSTYQSFKSGNKPLLGFTGNPLKSLDKSLIKKLPYLMDLKTFREGYEKVAALYKPDAEKMIEIAAKEMHIKPENGEKLSIAHIEKAAKDNNDKVIIGKNATYRIIKAASSSLALPFTLFADLGRFVVNIGRKILKKEPVEKEKSGCYYEEYRIKNMIKWADKVHEKMNDKLEKMEGKLTDPHNAKLYEEAQGRYGKNSRDFFNTKVMEYGADVLSNLTKLTGFVTVPFLAVDAYNVTLGKTQNKEHSQNKAKQRAIQDSTRQGVSFWFVKIFNNTFKTVSNSNLPSSGAVTGIQTFAYEALTRKIAGQPILPTTHEKMIELEKDKKHSKNWFVKLMAGRLKISKDEDQPAALQAVPQPAAKLPSAQVNPSFSINSANKDKENQANIFKQFASAN